MIELINSCNNQQNRLEKPYLWSQDPYFIPGYSGYLPQHKYLHGKRYGAFSNEILSNPDGIYQRNNLCKSGITTKPIYDKEDIKDNHKFSDPLFKIKYEKFNNRNNSFGDQKYKSPMLPGYTGFIPQSYSIPGKSFEDVVINGITTLEEKTSIQINSLNDIKLDKYLNEGLINIEDLPPNSILKLKTHKMPLKSISSKSSLNKINFSFNEKKLLSAYEMSDDDENKYFIPGYTGFVPFMNDFGSRYSKQTHNSLNKFKKVYEKSINLNNEIKNKNNGNCVYSVNSPIIPKYTGHIPGYRYKFGETFGNSTINARKI